tara:strand:- start:34420 stop:35820 length:1401 start_codon:yes stop_codon:yes gene_type:complete
MALKNPHGLALEGPETQWTYAELDGVVEERASRLSTLGAGPGVKVLLASELNIEAVEVVHSVFRTRSTLVPVNPRLLLGNEAFDQVNPEIVLVSKTLRKKYSPLLKNYNDRSDLAVDSDLLSVWVSKNLDEFKPDQLDGSANLPAALIFTSGTEGISKTIQISHEALEHSAYAIGSRLSLAATDRWYASLSLGHVGGLALVHRAAWNGATLLVDGEFSTERLVGMIEDREITHTSLVPTMLHDLIGTRGTKQVPSSLKVLIVGGAPTNESLLNEALSLGYPIVLTYGMTETCSQVTTATVELVKQKPGTAGAPIHGLEVKIDDEEIFVRGPTVASDVTDEEGWFATGDLGGIDESGHLWVRGRQRDIIITGGVNVDPLRVANEIREVAGVSDAVVVGLENERWGETVGALVVLESCESMSESAILEILSVKLSKSELPRTISFAERIPTSPNGKIDFATVQSLLRS